MQKAAKASIIFIFITVVIDVVGLGIIIPVLPALISELTGQGVQQAAQYGGYLMFAYASTQFLFASVLGNLSDCYGRRPVLLLALLGFCINYVLMGFASSLSWLFLGRFIAGITGASITVATAYIADISSPEKKAQNFGLIGAAFGLGFIIGPTLGGLLGHYGPRIPFYAAGILSFLNFAYGYFVIPESLKKENRRPFQWKRANPVGAFRHLQKYPQIGVLALSIFFINLAAHAIQSTWSYYSIARYGWSERMIGLSLGIIGVCITIVQAGLIRIALPRLGLKSCIILGLALYCLAYPIIGLAATPFILFAGMAPYVLGGIAQPALQSVISNQIPADQQGQIQGAITSVISLTAIIGPPLMNQLFAWGIRDPAQRYIPGAPYFLSALLVLLTLWILLGYFRKQRVP